MSQGTLSYLCTTDPGLEFLLAEEWQALCTEANLPLIATRERAYGRRGLLLVEVEATEEAVRALLPRLRAAHHVMRYLHHLMLPDQRDLAPLEAALHQLEIPGIEAAASFRVTTKRAGQHEFDSYAIASLAGRVVQARFGTPVDLTDYALNLRVDVYDRLAWIGLQETRQSLSRRFEDRPYYRSVSLKPTMAYALLRLARIPAHTEGRLLDPFCGAGTILLEAAELFPQLALCGSDRYEEPVAGAQANLLTYGLQDRAEIRQVDVRELSQHYPAASFDYLVTNPPFGLRLAQKVDLRHFYGVFLSEAAALLKPEGTLTLLMLKAASFRQTLAQSPFRVLDVHRVELGGKELRVYRLGKIAR
jgi:putative N6-adenine-specific DNA methylase/tRNA (guanine6-N2)-methyltransferase